MLTDTRSITRAAARIAAAEAVRIADELGIRVCVAVVDPAGHPVTFDRMDGAPLLCAELAQDKAHTVSMFGLQTHEWWEMVKDDPSLVHGVVKTPRLIVYGGGARISADGSVVGAVGISGGSPDQDRHIAEAAAAVCEQQWQE